MIFALATQFHVLNVKVVNQEEALVGASSVIVKLKLREGSFPALLGAAGVCSAPSLISTATSTSWVQTTS